MGRDETLERAVEWVSRRGYATGYANTIEDLLEELIRQTDEEVAFARRSALSPQVFAFAIGDEVVHTGIVGGPNTGRVVALEFEGKPSVVVEFPPWPTSKSQKPWRGSYDERWLEQYPGRLMKSAEISAALHPRKGEE